MPRPAAPRVLWIPVAAAVLVQAILLATVTPEIAVDSASYLAQAESLAASGSARNALGEPDTVRTPGYPLYLAAFLFAHAGVDGAIVGQRVLWILVVAASTWICFRLTASATAAVVTGLIVALDLPALQGTSSVLTETLATVLVGAAVWQAYRVDGVSAAIAAGILAAFTALVRPVAILLAVPLALAIAIAGTRAYRLRAAIIIVVTSLAITSAWIARNYLQTGVATFSSISSVNLLMFRAAGTLAIRDPGGIDVNIQRRQAELENAACRAAEARFGRLCAAVPMTDRASLYGELAWPILIADPVAVAMQAGRAAVMIMFGGGANLLSRASGMSESAARLLALGYTLPLAGLAALGIAYWRRIDRLAAWLMVLTILYLVVMALGAEAYSRFRVPFLPLYAMLAGGGAAALAERWTRRTPLTH